MIRINVAEIKKRLVGSKTFAYELTPDELDITDTDLKVTAPIQLEGVVENAGDVILLKADVKTEIERTCGRSFGSSLAVTLQGRLPWAVSGLRG